MSRLFVYGAGGIGLLLQYLIGKNDECTLIARQRTKNKLESGKLIITGALEDSLSVTCKTIDELDNFNSQDFIFVATKADQALSIVENIEKKLGDEVVVVLCQNGIGLYEMAKVKFPNLVILRLNCWMGAQRIDLDKVNLAGTFKFDISGDKLHKSKVELIEDLLKKTDIRVDAGFDPVLAEWQKALWNIAVNGLCSIVDAKNGAILDSPDLKEISKNLLVEAKTVANHAGVRITDKDLENVFASLEKTRANTNATLQDLRAGRHPEIEFLNGAVVKCARDHDQKAPLNETIVGLVNFLEKVEARRKQAL